MFEYMPLICPKLLFSMVHMGLTPAMVVLSVSAAWRLSVTNVMKEPGTAHVYLG